MLKILNERTCLSDIREINQLGIVRFEKYFGNHKRSQDLFMLKYESDIYDPKKWNLVSNQDNINLYTSEVADSSYLALKAESEVNCNIHNAIDFLRNINNITTYNHTINSTELIKKFSQNMLLYKTNTVKMYGISARDFILFHNHHFNKEENSHYIFSLSVDNESINKKYKKDNNNVRGEIIISGHYLQELDENKCKIALITHVELNGSIPSIAINNLIHNDTVVIFKNLIKKLEEK